MDNATALGLAAVFATALGSLGVIGQILVARRQANLQEAAAYRDQVEAWMALRSEWHRLLAAGLGPNQATNRGVPRHVCQEYSSLLEEYRSARVAAQIEFDEGYDEERQEALWKRESEAWDALLPMQDSVRRVLLHFAQLSALIIRRRLSVDAVYDALAHDVLREREAITAVTRHAYDYGGCVGPIFEESRWWSKLTLDEVSPRIGWARVLEASPGTLTRIDVLLDLLAIKAHSLGDGVSPVTGDAALRLVGSTRRLAVRWRLLRRIGFVTAVRLTSRAAWTSERLKMRRPRVLWALMRPILVSSLVLLAAARSRFAWDAERWVPRLEDPMGDHGTPAEAGAVPEDEAGVQASIE